MPFFVKKSIFIFSQFDGFSPFLGVNEAYNTLKAELPAYRTASFLVNSAIL
jgi:hypothetical protein